MGIYLNPDNIRFKEAVASEIYVDKTGLISYTNKVFGTQQKYMCVSRPRRFGKSMALCMQYSMDFMETKHWYDGYRFRRVTHIYSPKSVVDAMLNQEFDNYWTQTETYEALKVYIEMNFDGLRDSIILMLSGEQCRINTNTFVNDMTTFMAKDDVLTLLIHLGYLAYNAEQKTVFIPKSNHPDKPAMIIELKWDKSAQGALSQIKNKRYAGSLHSYTGNLLLVGINYDKSTKIHECFIEEMKL